MAGRRTTSTHVVTDRAQREALASPLRLEIIGHFEHGRELSVGDVARRMGRPAASMYFHVHKLVGAGLLVEGAARGRGPATEALYRAVADRIALQLNPGSAASVEAASRTVRALLRQAGREFERACRSGTLPERMFPQATTGRRQRVRLSGVDAAEARRRLDAVERFLIRRNRKSGGIEHTWTSLFIPVGDAPGRGRHRRKGGGK
ncbi:MAG: hypothetical protein FLDDKLPJ_01328 [Phycisphaerae bacterium]|nr:hypothetical protein [Phycisphaerae bacterium]